MADVTERAAAINGLIAYRRKLEADLAALQREMAEIDHALQVLRGQASPQRSANTPSMQSEIEGFLKSNPGQWFSTTQVITLLEQRGLNLATRSKRSSIAAGLQRLEVKTGFEKRQIAGKKRFEFRYVGSDEGSGTAGGEDDRAEHGSLL